MFESYNPPVLKHVILLSPYLKKYCIQGHPTIIFGEICVRESPANCFYVAKTVIDPEKSSPLRFRKGYFCIFWHFIKKIT